MHDILEYPKIQLCGGVPVSHIPTKLWQGIVELRTILRIELHHAVSFASFIGRRIL
jgi:hypothetical protein